MNEKVNQLLAKIDAEVETKVKAKVAEKDAEIKAAAQAAYDESVANSISKIKEEVEGEYTIARKYLETLLVPEEPIASEEAAQPEAPMFYPDCGTTI